ncbi:MAG: nucleotidyltransferase family protein [Burkholderiaceae bacterium]|nr:nucleotidyltransferase family protein [Burkholderiaceae bacterium]
MPAAAGTIVGILLAAGRGTRFDPSGQTSKLLAAAPAGPHAGAPLALAAARTLRGVLSEVVAVVRPPDTPAQQELHRLLRDAGCRLAINARAEEGMGGSIAAGVRASTDAAGWLVALADMPAVAPPTISAVRDALAAGAPSAAPMHQGRRGHPVGFAARLGPLLLALQGDAGARSVLVAHPPLPIPVDDPGCLLDLDSAADFAAPQA